MSEESPVTSGITEHYHSSKGQPAAIKHKLPQGFNFEMLAEMLPKRTEAELLEHSAEIKLVFDIFDSGTIFDRDNLYSEKTLRNMKVMGRWPDLAVLLSQMRRFSLDVGITKIIDECQKWLIDDNGAKIKEMTGRHLIQSIRDMAEALYGRKSITENVTTVTISSKDDLEAAKARLHQLCEKYPSLASGDIVDIEHKDISEDGDDKKKR